MPIRTLSRDPKLCARLETAVETVSRDSVWVVTCGSNSPSPIVYLLCDFWTSNFMPPNLSLYFYKMGITIWISSVGSCGPVTGYSDVPNTESESHKGPTPATYIHPKSYHTSPAELPAQEAAGYASLSSLDWSPLGPIGSTFKIYPGSHSWWPLAEFLPFLCAPK